MPVKFAKVISSSCQPDHDCGLCPRLVAFRTENRKKFPTEFNAPVPAFGDNDPYLLVVGLAPGLKGANFTGRPFTADYAGDLLYPSLIKFGFARGTYKERADDGVELIRARITNAVKCVPPENKPTGDEMATCLPFLEKEFATLKNLRAIIALGTIAHNSVLKALGFKMSDYKFGHANIHALMPKKHLAGKVTLIDSYHCSRYNVNTGRLTTEMFEDVMRLAVSITQQSKAA